MKLKMENNILDSEINTSDKIVYNGEFGITNNAMHQIVEELHTKTLEEVLEGLETCGLNCSDLLKRDLHMRQKLIKSSPLYV